MNIKAEQKKPEPSEQSKAQARQWGKRLERALKKQTEAGQEKRFKKLRQYVRGEVGDDGKGGLVRTNIIHSNFAAILPQIYAKNPEIAVTPTDAAEGAAWVPGFCKTLESVMQRKFVFGAKLKKRAKSAIRSAMTTSIGWAKVSWQKDTRTDPLIENRIADSQDNLQRTRHLIDEIEEGDGRRDELEAQKAELEQQIESLRKQVEVKVVSGLVIDRILTEDMFVLDDTLFDFDGYEQGEALAHRVWMTCDEYKQRFGRDVPKAANRYSIDKKDRGNSGDDTQLVAVFEAWHLGSNTVFTLCAGADEWARDPYQPEVIGQRFYPFFPLAFNLVDGRPEPISDAELLIELQDEYNTTRTNFAEHRKENLPVRFYRKSGNLTDETLNKIANRKANDLIGLDGDPNTPVQNDIGALENPPIDPSVYDVTPILRDAEMVLGAGDASKGTINKAKTATEAEIMAMGLQSRVAERQDVVEDWISEMAQYAAELLLQHMTPDEVRQIAGKNAVWPQLTKDQVFDLVHVEIRAGSTGRPNRAREQEQWARMLPEIKEAVKMVSDLRAAGQNDMAETILKLLEETLRRFDERIDIEQFIPARPEQEESSPQIPPEVQQQMQQAEAMLEQLQQENAALQAAAADKTAEQDAMRQKAELEASARIEEARVREEERTRAAVEVARIRAESEERIAAMNAQQSQAMATMLQQMQEAMACMTKMMAHMGGMPVQTMNHAPDGALDDGEPR